MFFTSRIYDVAPRIPLGGIENSGWRLTYDGSTNPFQRACNTMYGQIDQTMSIGLQVSPTGDVQDVVLDSAALRVDYHGGVLFPHLERQPSRPDVLSAILASRAGR